MIYLQKFNEGIFKSSKSKIDEPDENVKLLIKSFKQTKCYELIFKRIKFIAGINGKVLSDISDIVRDEYNLKKIAGNGGAKLYLPYSDDLTITVYKDRPKDRREFYQYDIVWFVFRMFMSEKRNDCIVVKVHKSFISKFLNLHTELKKEPAKEEVKKPSMSGNAVIELLIRFQPFEDAIIKKHNGLFDINSYIIDSISGMVCREYSLYVKRGDNKANFSQFYDSMIVLSISREVTNERDEFYMDGDWYVFRIFICNSNKDVCLSVKLHKNYLNTFLNRKIKSDPWVIIDTPTTYAYTPPAPVKKVSIDDVKELMLKIKNKRNK